MTPNREGIKIIVEQVRRFEREHGIKVKRRWHSRQDGQIRLFGQTVDGRTYGSAFTPC